MEPTAPGPRPLRVLMIEDSEFDARIITSVLRAAGYDITSRRVETAPAMREALAGQAWDIVFSDHQMPEFDAARALRVLQDSGLDLPFLIVSGGIGEETAVALMKAGAHDFLMKGQLGRLVPAVQRELREAANRADRRASELRLRRLWETSPDAVLMMDEQGRIAFANPAAAQTFGLPVHALLGRTFGSLLAVESESPALIAGPATPEGQAPPLIEMTGRHASGRDVILEVAFSDTEMQGRHYHIAFVRDITERRAAEQALRAAEKEFELARDIQQRLFPKHPPHVPRYDIAGATYPAVQAGGDHFDYLTMPEGDLCLVVSDVSGHGMGPALIMAETRAYLRIAAYNRRDTGQVLTRANSVLAEDLEDGSRFVTSLLVRLVGDDSRLAFASAGHTAGYILDRHGTLKLTLARRGPPLGLLPDTIYEESPPIALESGDVVLLLTDGIEEAESPEGEVFGADRILDVVRQRPGAAAADLVAALYAAVQAFSRQQSQRDDCTLVVVRVT